MLSRHFFQIVFFWGAQRQGMEDAVLHDSLTPRVRLLVNLVSPVSAANPNLHKDQRDASTCHAEIIV